MIKERDVIVKRTSLIEISIPATDAEIKTSALEAHLKKYHYSKIISARFSTDGDYFIIELQDVE